MTSQLPLVISIPHGGLTVPPEIAERVACPSQEIFRDSDAGALEIYDVGGRVHTVMSTAVARAVVDLNRAPDDRPPSNPDGVVKSRTSYGIPVYVDGQHPDDVTVQMLLDRYYHPYHRALEEACGKEVLLAFDCHTMAAEGPEIAPDTGRVRPALCVSDADGRTCDPGTTDNVRRCLAEAFEVGLDEVTRNEPFKGGHIARSHATRSLPWVQIEMSRGLFVRTSDRAADDLDASRLAELRARFLSALERVVAELS